jgi:hypothetical protein
MPIGKKEGSMYLKRFLGAAGLSLLWTASLSAATVSFLVIETGLGQGEGRKDFSSLWETGLMDVFFDAGHIVSNSPVMRLQVVPEEEFPGDALAELDEAREGGVDFFIIALLDYRGSPPEGNQRPPRAISLRLFSINPYRLLFEQSYSGIVSVSANEDFLNAKRAAQIIIPHLKDIQADGTND